MKSMITLKWCFSCWDTDDFRNAISGTIVLSSLKGNNTLRSEWNGWYFAEDIFTCCFLNGNFIFCVKLLISFESLIDNKSTRVHLMACRQTDDKPLNEPMLMQLTGAYVWNQILTHWPLGDVVILKVESPNTHYRLSSLVKLLGMRATKHLWW